ncbi:MAG: Na/Pi symporter [Gammaproteobacteria bacterium]|jgi:phosphate:Na+ symporter
MYLFKRLTLPAIILALAWGFWTSEDFLRLSAGVAFFMFGMLSLEKGFQAFTGGVLEKVLAASTGTRLRSMGFGLVTTALMQSSSLVSLITITFLSAGLIGLAQGIGIIFGSNIGTTTGAWLMASFGVKIDLAIYAMPMAVFGILFMYQKSNTMKGAGNVLLGIAFLFLGIQFIKEGFEAVSQGMDLSRFALEGFAGTLVFVLIGIFATVVMQSSHAVLMLTIAALVAGQVTYYNALALAIGTNVGTTITAVLGAMGAKTAGRRLAGAHLVFNLTTGLIAVLFISQLAALVDVFAAWVGIADDDYTLKLASFHTLFNMLGVLIMLPLVDRLVIFLEKVLPEKLVVDGVEQPRFLVDSLVDYPDAALVALTRETQHLALNVLDIIARAIGLSPGDILGSEPMDQVVSRSRAIEKIPLKDLYQSRVKAIYSAILEFSVKAQPRMSGEQAANAHELRESAKSWVNAVKALRLVRKNMLTYATSDNAEMRSQYDRFRLHIGELIRALIELREIDDPEFANQRIQELQQRAAADNVVDNGHLDKLIREDLITSEMASSLMNDTAYVSELHRQIIKAARILYVTRRQIGTESAELPEAGSGLSAEERQRISEMLRRSREDIDAAIERARQGG